MSKKHQRRKKKGILTGLGKGRSSGTPKKGPWYKRVLTWVGVTFLVGVFLVVVVGTAIGLLNPRIAIAERGEFVVREIRDGNAVVVIHDQDVPISLGEQAATIRAGTSLHVEYLYTPRRQTVQVTMWDLSETVGTP